LHLRSDVKLGSCLSGGIDSSSIVCTANQLLRNKNQDKIFETVSAIYHEKNFSEEKFVDIITSLTNVISHKVYPLYSNLFDQLDSIIWHQDEPFINLSIFAQWCVFEESSKKNVKVMLDGQGADEYMAGYESFYGIYMSELLCRFKVITFFSEFYSIFKNHGSKKAIISFYWALNNLLNRISFIPESLKLKLKMAVTKSNIKYLKLKSNSEIDKIYKNASKSLKTYSKTLLTEITIPTLLHYEDRNSMAFSIESRVPFLDFRLVEFFYSLPSNFKIRNSVTKFMFREAMKDILPSDIKNRKDKVGFATPQYLWVKENLDFFNSELENSCEILHKIIDKKIVLNLFEISIKNGSESVNKFWSIIIFARWVKIYKLEL
jgi:asparagine synthase (glutamine-hydrolysing)